jgi:hypothetical protein
MKTKIAFLLTLLGIFSSFPALAVEAYKTQNGVEISGLAPSDLIKVYYGGVTTSLNIATSGSCNYITLRNQSGKNFSPMNTSVVTKIFDVDGTTVKFSYSGGYQGGNLPTVYTPISPTQLCSSTDKNPSLPWQTLGGNFLIKAYEDQSAVFHIFIPGLKKGSYKVDSGIPAQRLVNSDKCGIVKINNTDAWPINKLGSFFVRLPDSEGTLSNIAWNYSSIPTRVNNNLCRNGVLYVPAS